MAELGGSPPLETPGAPPPRIRGPELVRGALWNQLGQALPILATLFLVPPLVRGLGVDRFGILSLAWMLIGYFTLFDLGISGALTRMVAERVAAGRMDQVPELVWTALTLTTLMGLLGGLMVAAAAPWLVDHALHVPTALQPETLGLLRILALSLPLVTGTAALAGVLAARRRFGLLNAIRSPMGVLTYAGPVLALSWSRSLIALGLVLAAIRLLGGIGHLVACLATTPGLRRGIVVRRAWLKPIVSFGGWMTVSAVVGPLMLYLDRFLIGAFLTMAMVAYYSTPYDLTSRMGILSMPIVSVLFPAIASSFDADPARARQLFAVGVAGVATLLFPVALVLTLFPRELLGLWLGSDFSSHSSRVLQLLATGMFVNGLAQVAMGFLQGSGRPDLGARLHMVELPVYVVTVWLLVRSHGIEGAAVAWLARVAVDALVLFTLARRRMAGARLTVRALWIAIAVAPLAFLAGARLPGFGTRILFAVVLLCAYAWTAWRHMGQSGLRPWLAFQRGGRA